MLISPAFVFDQWRSAFELETIVGAVEKDKASETERPTGKQLFLSNKAGMEEALLLAAEQDDATVEISEDLFVGGEFDLDDFSDDDDEEYVPGDDEEYEDGDDDDDDDD